jgi:hypothetical protein
MPANDASSGRHSPGSGRDVLTGRPDLEKDALKELRERQRMLKSEAKRVATDLRNKKKQKKRAMRRCATLQTRDIVQVLLERGVVIPNTDSEAMSGAASSSGDPALADVPDVVDNAGIDIDVVGEDAAAHEENMASATLSIA